MASCDRRRIPRLAAEWMAGLTGPYRILAPAGFPPSRHRVYTIQGERGSFFLKLHRDEKSWHAETYAYGHWCGVAPSNFAAIVGVFRTPRLRGILTRALPGRPLENLEFSEDVIRAAWHAAGRLASLVHDQAEGRWFGAPDMEGRPLGHATMDAAKYVRNELLALEESARLRSLLSAEEWRAVRWAHENCGIFDHESPRPVNPDYAPGNWLVDEDGRFLGAVDLEEMHWGVRLEAFSHLWAKFTLDHPAREAAFFDGYGMNPHEVCPLQVRHVCIRTGLANIVLGSERGDVRYLNRGRRLLRQYRDHPD